MCLKYKFNRKRKKEFLNKFEDDEITVYKVAVKIDDKYFPPYSPDNKEQYEGTKKAEVNKYKLKVRSFINGKLNKFSYKTGFHFFIQPEPANKIKEYHDNFKHDYKITREYCVISAIVKKSWITNVGIEHDIDGNNKIVVVTKKAIFNN